MTIASLDNLVRIKQLNSKPPDKREITGLMNAAIDRLKDAQNDALSFASRFDLAYEHCKHQKDPISHVMENPSP